MKVQEVERRYEEKQIVHNACNLDVSDGVAMLSGPQYGAIANALVRSVSTMYNGSDYQIRLEVLNKLQGNNYRRESWYVKF